MITKKTIISKITLPIITILISFMLFGCTGEDSTSKEVVAEKYRLLSAYVEFRNETNRNGGIIGTNMYFHYAFSTDSGEVLFKEKEMYDTYDGVVYSLEFKIGDENTILQYNYSSKTKLVFVMTENMYKQVFTN